MAAPADLMLTVAPKHFVSLIYVIVHVWEPVIVIVILIHRPVSRHLHVFVPTPATVLRNARLKEIVLNAVVPGNAVVNATPMRLVRDAKLLSES